MEELWSALALCYLLMTSSSLVVRLGFGEVVEPFDVAILIGAFSYYRSIYYRRGRLV